MQVFCEWCKNKNDRCYVSKNSTCSKYEPIKQTQADMIRSMTDEELADFLDEISNTCHNTNYSPQCMSCEEHYCKDTNVLRWLQSEVNT